MGTKIKVMMFMGPNAEPVSVFKDSCDHRVLFCLSEKITRQIVVVLAGM